MKFILSIDQQWYHVPFNVLFVCSSVVLMNILTRMFLNQGPQNVNLHN